MHCACYLHAVWFMVMIKCSERTNWREGSKQASKVLFCGFFCGEKLKNDTSVRNSFLTSLSMPLRTEKVGLVGWKHRICWVLVVTYNNCSSPLITYFWQL